MGDEMNPRAALAAAAAARSAAAGNVTPGWFPLASASAFAVGMTLLGVALLAGGGAGRVLGVAGAVVLAGFAALWVVLAAWWRRRGLVPVPPSRDRRLPPRQRRAGLAADFAGTALTLATLAVTGRPGWAAIVAGWLLGAALWYRLQRRAA